MKKNLLIVGLLAIIVITFSFIVQKGYLINGTSFNNIGLSYLGVPAVDTVSENCNIKHTIRINNFQDTRSRMEVLSYFGTNVVYPNVLKTMRQNTPVEQGQHIIQSLTDLDSRISAHFLAGKSKTVTIYFGNCDNTTDTSSIDSPKLNKLTELVDKIFFVSSAEAQVHPLIASSYTLDSYSSNSETYFSNSSFSLSLPPTLGGNVAIDVHSTYGSNYICTEWMATPSSHTFNFGMGNYCMYGYNYYDFDSREGDAGIFLGFGINF